MNIRIKLVLGSMVLAGVGALAGCGGGGGGNPTPPPPPPPPPPTTGSVAFPAFVKATLKQPADSVPRKVNNVDFTFPALNNPHAFDDVLPPPSGTASGG